MANVSSDMGGATNTTYLTEACSAPAGMRLLAAVLWRRSLHAGTPSGGVPDVPMGWSGAWDEDGGRAVLFDDERRVVVVLGREYPLPSDERTLVLLAEEGAVAGESASVTVLLLASASVPREPHDRTLGKEARLAQLVGEARRRDAAWDALLRSDPIIRRFLDAPDAHRAT